MLGEVVTVEGEDWTKQVSLAVTKWWLSRLENIWHVSFHGRETNFVKFNATWVGLL